MCLERITEKKHAHTRNGKGKEDTLIKLVKELSFNLKHYAVEILNNP